MLDYRILQQGEKFSVEYCWRRGQLFGFMHILDFCTEEAARDWVATRNEFEETDCRAPGKSD